MNPSCCACDNSAKYICEYLDCQEDPYLCGGPCAKGSSEKIHTHSKVKNIILYEDFANRLESINNSNPHQQYFQKLEKRVQVLKQQFLIEIERICLQHKHDISVSLSSKLTDSLNTLIEKIQNNKNGESLTGKDVHRIMNEKNIYQEEIITKTAINNLKEKLDRGLKQLENIYYSDDFLGYEEIVQKSKQLNSEGKQLISQKKIEQALKKYMESEKLNNFDSETYRRIGFCLEQTDKAEEAMQYFLKSVQLKPSSGVLNNIALIYMNNNLNKQAIEYFTKSIEFNEQVDALELRGDCYSRLKMYQRALSDYTRANQLIPCSDYASRINDMKIVMQFSKLNSEKPNK